MLDLAKHNEPAPNVAANDPSAVFVVKSLLYPLAAVATLYACVLWWREYPAGPYFLLGVLTFITAAEFLDVVPLHKGQTASWALRLFLDISLRWSLVVTFLWVLLYLSGLSIQYRSSVVLSWV
jgi:hypothetical protein